MEGVSKVDEDLYDANNVHAHASLVEGKSHYLLGFSESDHLCEEKNDIKPW